MAGNVPCFSPAYNLKLHVITPHLSLDLLHRFIVSHGLLLLRDLWVREPYLPRLACRVPATSDSSRRILLLSQDEFCNQPLEPFPDWLTARGITPVAWRELVWAIDCEMVNATSRDRGWRSPSDATQILPRVSAIVAAYVARIAPQWATRGLRIEYIEGPIYGVRQRPSGDVTCRMDNRLLFSPTSSPAPERPSMAEVNHYRKASTGRTIWLRDLQLNRGVAVPPLVIKPWPGPENASATDTGPPVAQTNGSDTNSVAAVTSPPAAQVQDHDLANSEPAPSGSESESAAVNSFPAGPRRSSSQTLLVAVAPVRVSTPLATAEAYAVPVLAHAEGDIASGVPISISRSAAVGEWKFCPSCGVSLQGFVLEGHPKPRFCPQCATPLAPQSNIGNGQIRCNRS